MQPATKYERRGEHQRTRRQQQQELNMVTCIDDCKRKVFATLCACKIETEAVDLSVVTLAAVVLKLA